MKKTNKYWLNLFLIYLLTSAFISCDNQEDIKTNNSKIIVNLEEFKPITNPHPYKNINIDSLINYWEFIYSEEYEFNKIILSTGNKCQNSKNQDECMSQYDSIKSDAEGFIKDDCLPSNCFYYIKYQKNNTNDIITNSTELKAFLGDIDTPSEAILLAASNNYRFNTTKKEIGGIKETPSGYEILMTKLVSDCLPVQTNRFLLQVDKNGTITVLDEEIYSRDDNGCI